MLISMFLYSIIIAKNMVSRSDRVFRGFVPQDVLNQLLIFAMIYYTQPWSIHISETARLSLRLACQACPFFKFMRIGGDMRLQEDGI